jgi:hypothetical protein
MHFARIVLVQNPTEAIVKHLHQSLGLPSHTQIQSLYQCNITRKLTVLLNDDGSDAITTLTASKPNFAELERIVFPSDWIVKGVIVTARADGQLYDFVSRYFAPW